MLNSYWEFYPIYADLTTRDLKPRAGGKGLLTIIRQSHVRSMRPWESLSRRRSQARAAAGVGGRSPAEGATHHEAGPQVPSDKGPEPPAGRVGAAEAEALRTKVRQGTPPVGFVCANARGKASNPAGLGFVRILRYAGRRVRLGFRHHPVRSDFPDGTDATASEAQCVVGTYTSSPPM
jgi:hypothetical protein